MNLTTLLFTLLVIVSLTLIYLINKINDIIKKLNLFNDILSYLVKDKNHTTENEMEEFLRYLQD